MLEITTLPREPKETKKEGFIPAVYYGAHTKSTPIFVDAILFNKVFASSGESATVALKTEHGIETVLVQDLQRDPVKNTPIHVDFYVLAKGQKVHVKVPFEFIGESPAVKAGHILVKVMHELSIEAEQNSIPQVLMVDISSLTGIDSAIHAEAITLPKGVSLYHVAPEEVIVAIAQATDVVDEPVAAIDLSTIEVEKKGKKEEEGETA